MPGEATSGPEGSEPLDWEVPKGLVDGWEVNRGISSGGAGPVKGGSGSDGSDGESGKGLDAASWSSDIRDRVFEAAIHG
jgi:hypothetical protein